jgi:Ca2+/H+ antiporter, TMEM165/GDT1 family
MSDMTAIVTVIASSFAASFVEAVEALTIVLAVGFTRGWPSSLGGATAGLGALALLVGALGPLLARAPVQGLEFVIGVLLLLFGLRWLRKAILREIGVIAKRDEAAAFSEQTRALAQGSPERANGLDWIAAIASFKAVLLEGVEVAFIVLAVGAGRGMLWPAVFGALAASIVVILIGAAVHRPLSRVPENTLKFAVGIMLSTFGLFWTGESLGVEWPGADAAIIGLAAVFLAVSGALVALMRPRLARAT